MQNASIYKIIRAIWNANIEDLLPQVDQVAIMEYYNEKTIEENEDENFFSKLWNLIKRLFGLFFSSRKISVNSLFLSHL